MDNLSKFIFIFITIVQRTVIKTLHLGVNEGTANICDLFIVSS